MKPIEVWVLEDDDSLRQSIEIFWTAVLENFGVVKVFAYSTDILNALEDINQEKPEILFIDYLLSVKDEIKIGTDVIKEIRKIKVEKEIYIIGHSSDDSWNTDLLKAGADHTLNKSNIKDNAAWLEKEVKMRYAKRDRG